jgi:hypothetical protein
MSLYVYVDNSNLCTEGKRLSAVNTGLAVDMHDAITRDVTDYSWSCDLGKLVQAVRPASESIGGSSVFGFRPTDADSLWTLAAQQGFEVAVSERHTEDIVDVALATRVMADSYERMQPGDTAVLVAGYRGYLPVIESLRDRGRDVRVAFWHHATARELRSGEFEFVSLDELFDALTT